MEHETSQFWAGKYPFWTDNMQQRASDLDEIMKFAREALTACAKMHNLPLDLLPEKGEGCIYGILQTGYLGHAGITIKASAIDSVADKYNCGVIVSFTGTDNPLHKIGVRIEENNVDASEVELKKIIHSQIPADYAFSQTEFRESIDRHTRQIRQSARNLSKALVEAYQRTRCLTSWTAALNAFSMEIGQFRRMMPPQPSSDAIAQRVLPRPGQT